MRSSTGRRRSTGGGGGGGGGGGRSSPPGGVDAALLDACFKDADFMMRRYKIDACPFGDHTHEW